MQETRLTLEDLSDATGLNPRTIRSYIQMQLLRGPEGKARGAYYTTYHVERLLAIRTLVDRMGYSLSQVRSRLAAMTPDEIRSLSGGPVTESRGRSEPLSLGSSSAAEYLRGLGVPGPSRLAVHHAAPNAIREKHTTLAASSTPIDRLALELDALLGSRTVPRQARGEPWFRIRITPDIELSIKGTPEESQLARLERIADYLREILLGGLSHQ